jgi:hypothetical protein
MPDSDTTQPQSLEDVTQVLSDTIGADVLAQMEDVGWEHTATPPAARRVDDPPPVASTETPQPPVIPDNPPNAATTGVIDWEALRDPTTGLILKKYKDEGAAVKGIGHAINMLKSGLNRIDTVEQENQRLQRELISRPAIIAPATEVPSLTIPALAREASVENSPKLARVLARIKEEPILDEEGMQELVDGILEHSTMSAERAARRVIRETAENVQKENTVWSEVDDYMAREYPESLAFADEMGVFTRTNPFVGEIVAAMIEKGKRTEATVFAWKEFKEAHSEKLAAPQAMSADTLKEIQLTEAGKVHAEAREAALRDAGVISSGASGVHETVKTGTTQEEIAAAAARMNQSADGTEWRNLVIGSQLTGPFFDNTG